MASENTQQNGSSKKTQQYGASKVASKRRSLLTRLKFTRDYHETLPLGLTRFSGYRPPGQEPPYEPISALKWVKQIPLQYEIWVLAWIGVFGGILLIEAIMSSSTIFRDVHHTPTIVTSSGASAVLLFGVIESPVAQPRNFVFGHFISALVGTCITRLFVLNEFYQGYLDNRYFHASTFINDGMSMATSLLTTLITGTAHLGECLTFILFFTLSPG